MGRSLYSNRQEADYLKQVNVSFLKKHGYFNYGWRSGTVTWSRQGEQTGNISIQSCIYENEKYIRFIYIQTDNYSGEKKDFDYKIPLTNTSCHFGGKRFWFKCPWYANGVYCGKRIGVLYKGGDYFACRHCYNLTYSSRKLSGASKIAGQVVSIPELEKLEKEAKTKFYAGKMTRKYKRYIKKQDKSHFQLLTMARKFGADI